LSKLLGNLNKGRLFVVSAPAGTGKTTLVEMLTKEFPCVKASVSFTTRAPRAGEIDGVHYNFIPEPLFEEKIHNGDFLEYANVFGYYYGTTKQSVLDQLDKGFHVILVIDTQGAMQVKKLFDTTLVFIAPPSRQELEKRLTLRKSDSSEVIAKRLQWAEREMETAKRYDYCLVNDDLDTAYQVLKSIFIAEEHRGSSFAPILFS
jgi:guanylate kinase